MAATLFSEAKHPLELLIGKIESGEIGLPDIQRPFIWKNTKVRDLFDSMYRGFPVGYFLFWNNFNGNGTKKIGTDSKQSPPRLLIVDGQQRLTSLFAVFKGKEIVREDFKKEHIHIAFKPTTEEFQVADAAIRKDPEWISDITEIWSKGSFRAVKDFLTTVKHEMDAEAEEAVSNAINRLEQLKNYNFTVLELSQEMDEEQVADVFVRINSKGISLNQADFILTLMSVHWEDGRVALEEFCRASRVAPESGPSPFNPFIKPSPDQMLRPAISLGFRRARLKSIYNILRGKDLETDMFSDELRDKQFATLQMAQKEVLNLQNWQDFFKALLLAGYRSSGMISSGTNLVYVYAMYLIGKRDFNVPHHDLRQVISRWFFMTALTRRYTASPESQMEEDLAQLREIKSASEFIDMLEGIIRKNFTDDYWAINLSNELESAAAITPSLYAYYAALNLLDAKVLFSNLKVSELIDPVTNANRSSLERHHLFPKGYLKAIGIKTPRETNQVANYALIEWPDNMKISDEAPENYFPDLMARFDQEELKQMMYWHALPHKWEHMQYQGFLAERRKLMAQVIRDGYQRIEA